MALFGPMQRRLGDAVGEWNERVGAESACVAGCPRRRIGWTQDRVPAKLECRDRAADIGGDGDARATSSKLDSLCHGRKSSRSTRRLRKEVPSDQTLLLFRRGVAHPGEILLAAPYHHGQIGTHRDP